MPPSGDQDDTQVLDFDSPLSGDMDCFLGGETLPLDYEETQLVDNFNGEELGEGFQEWGKTQAIDLLEETEIVQHEDEWGEGGPERKELVDDGAGKTDDFGEVGSAVRTKEANLVDSDASTDEEDDHDIDKPGSSGCGNTCIPNGQETKSYNLHEDDFNTHNHEEACERHTEMVTMPCSIDTKDKIILDCDAENSSRNIEGCSRCFYSCKEEEAQRSKLNIEKLASQSPLRYGQAAAGLSYISSQDPGIQSQIFALSVVDKFLSANNVGLSQDLNNENTDTVVSPPIASVKRAQCFVRKSDKSMVGKARVYDWNDSLEDEGGGELFTRRKKSFFGGKGSKRISHSLPSKVAFNGAKHRTSQKLASLSKTMKNFINEKNEQNNTEMTGQLEKSVDHVSDEDGNNIGPATQMAAEAMQALGQLSHANFEQSNLQSKCKVEVTGKFTKILKARRTSLRKTSARKMGLEDSTEELAKKIATKKSGKSCKEVMPVNDGGYAALIVGETMTNIVEKEVEKPPILMTYCKQPLIDAKCAVGTSEMYTSPVAHRTRLSKAAKVREDAGRHNLNAHRIVEIKDEFAFNASIVQKVNMDGYSRIFNVDNGNRISGLGDDDEMERTCVEKTEACVEKTEACHYKDENRELKRRKMNIDSSNQATNSKKNPIKPLDDVIDLKIIKPAIENKKRKVFIRSIAEILDTVKRKKRSISSNCKSDDLPSNVGKMRDPSGIQGMSSFLSDILKPYFAIDTHLKKQISYKTASKGATNIFLVSSDKQVAKENANQEEAPNTVTPLGLSCSQTTISVSPVHNSHDASRSSFRKSSSRSPISRELIRLEASYASPLNLNDVRRKKDVSRFLVCFSNHLSQGVIKQQKKISERLGIQVVSSSLKATHFIADEFARTRNMLEAMAMGKPVVTPMWLESCGQASSYIDEKNFILRDARKEKEIGFSMPVSLARACQHPLLQGKRVFITRNAMPDQKLISSLVETAGGQPLKITELSIAEEDEVLDNLIILSGEEDFAVCASFVEKGIIVFSSELLLNGIVIQKLEYERHQLFSNQNKRRR